MASRKLIVEIVGDSRSLERSFRNVESRTDKFSKRLSGRAKAGLIGAGVVGTAIVTKQLKASVDAALEAEKAQTRLRGAFKSAGAAQVAYARATKQIAQVSRDAALDDEDLSDSLAKLTRTTGSAQKGLKGMALAANIARARGISLEAATKIVEKAFIGQLRGLKAVGVEIDRNTTATQAIDLAQRKFAGSAEAYGKTAAASQERLGVAFENLQEKIGQKLLPVLQKLAIRLTELISWTEKNWPRISKIIKDSVAAIRPAIDLIVATVQGMAKAIQGVVNIIKGIKDGDWTLVWQGIRQVAVDGVFAIVKATATLPTRILQALGKEAWAGLSRIGAFIKDAAIGGLKGLADGVISVLKNAIQQIIDFVNGAAGPLRGVLGKVGVDLPKIPDLVVKGSVKRDRSRDVPLPRAVKRDRSHDVPLPTATTRFPTRDDLTRTDRGGVLQRRVRVPDAAAAGVNINGPITVVADNPEAFLRQLQKKAGKQSATRSGRFGGRGLGLG